MAFTAATMPVFAEPATTHLKGVDVPRDALTVFTRSSGAGKTSRADLLIRHECCYFIYDGFLRLAYAMIVFEQL